MTPRTTKTKRRISVRGNGMKTYLFKVVIEPDEDVWTAHCPELLTHGASTWGKTKTEALRHIHEVLEMIVEEFTEERKSLPGTVRVFKEPMVAVTL